MKSAFQSMASGIKQAVSSVGRTIEKLKEGSLRFVAETREHGLCESVERLFSRSKESFQKNVVPHFKSKESILALLERVGGKLKIDKVAETVANALTFIKERVSQYLDKRRNGDSEAQY